MRLLQVCNVGTVLGGTGACAWSVTQAVPEWSHRVAVLGPVREDMRAAMASIDRGPIPVESIERVTASVLADADAVLLHNTPRGRVAGEIDPPTLLMRHSAADHAAATASVCCSQTLRGWLRGRAGENDPVLHQGVPQPASCGRPRSLGERVGVVWLCTPQRRKWPRERIGFCRRLAAACPHVDFTFVGCPTVDRRDYEQACGGRATFAPASVAARRWLSDADALLYSNRGLPETFGRTVAEAMLAGCIPVVDDLGGFREQVTPSTGRLCRDERAFIAALHELRDPFTRRRLSAAAASHAQARFSHAAFGRRLRQAMTQLLAGEPIAIDEPAATSAAWVAAA